MKNYKKVVDMKIIKKMIKKYIIILYQVKTIIYYGFIISISVLFIYKKKKLHCLFEM